MPSHNEANIGAPFLAKVGDPWTTSCLLTWRLSDSVCRTKRLICLPVRGWLFPDRVLARLFRYDRANHWSCFCIGTRTNWSPGGSQKSGVMSRDQAEAPSDGCRQEMQIENRQPDATGHGLPRSTTSAEIAELLTSARPLSRIVLRRAYETSASIAGCFWTDLPGISQDSKGWMHMKHVLKTNVS